jgi:hypothetical protein
MQVNETDQRPRSNRTVALSIRAVFDSTRRQFARGLVSLHVLSRGNDGGDRLQPESFQS